MTARRPREDDSDVARPAAGEGARSTFRRAVVWLLFLGPFFFATYGFANWMASRRTHVGSVVFAWEHRIPFVPWTIVPYWSIDLLYGLSLLVCTTRRELDRHAQRLLAVQLLCIACFLAFPLRFSFAHPPASGIFGAMFAALGSFDKPFNQAPSLHIALLVVIWTRLAAHAGARWRWALHAWMTLIGVSILTTYQHHFVDLPTGLLAGFVVLWALPDDAPVWTAARVARDARRRLLAARYASGALVCAALACAGGPWLWLVWPAVSLAVVALNYAVLGERGFGKREGRMSAGAWGLLAPYVAAAWVNSRLWTRRLPRVADVADGVAIGRMPAARDLDGFATVVDLAAELPCPRRDGVAYRAFPLLDLTTPDAATLRAAAAAIEVARTEGRVLVCCALGYSRSAAAVAAWLLLTRRAGSVAEAMSIVQRARPQVVLHAVTLEAFA